MKRWLWAGLVVVVLTASMLDASAQQADADAPEQAKKAAKTKLEEKVPSATKPDKEPAEASKQAVDRVTLNLEREEDKHRRRVARLERVREMLVKKGNEKAVARVDEILKKQTRHHERKMQKLRKRNTAATKRFDERIERVRQRNSKRRAEKASQRGGKKGETPEAGRKAPGKKKEKQRPAPSVERPEKDKGEQSDKAPAKGKSGKGKKK